MKRVFNILFILLIYPLVSFDTGKELQSANEAEVKAAFIVNFAKYIDWESPNFNNSQNFKIGIVGDEAVYKSLKNISSKKIKEKSIELKYFNSINDIEECHILYLSKDLPLKDLKSCSGSVKNKYTLLISDKRNALDYGAGINFVLVGENLKFEINQKNLTVNKLKVSSQLLKLATNVER